MNIRVTQLLLAAVAVLLALNLYVSVPSRNVFAQTQDRWRVMAVYPSEDGAKKLEGELNTGWNFHSMSSPHNGMIIAVLQRAVR